jgi:hypothetical protein
MNKGNALVFKITNVNKKKKVGRYSGGQNKVGQVLLRNLAKIELSKPGLL